MRRPASPDGPHAPRDVDLEIDGLIADAHRRLPRDECELVGAIYARYSTRTQGSIGDQVRAVLEAALKLKVFVPREHVHHDAAVRGCKDRRPGLDRLRALLARGGAVQIVLIFSTNRLARKVYRALQFVHEEIVERGVRCVFTSTGVDTADAGRWSLMLQAHAMVDEVVVASASAHVRAGQEGLFALGRVHGAVTFGYRGRELEGLLTKKGLPARVYEVDPEAAPWVARAFEWYARDGVSIAEVARRLNGEPRAALNSRLLAGWSQASVRRLLANGRYRGAWEYGRYQSVYKGREDYVVQVRRDEPLMSAQWEPLRIVPDDLWLRAQVRLGEGDRRAAGRKPRDGDGRSRPRALGGLFFCAAHGRMMYSGGDHGKMLICKDCQATGRALKPLCSVLNRGLALRLICATLARRLRADEGLAAEVAAACRAAAAALQAPDPARLDELRARDGSLTRRIGLLMDNLGLGDRDVRESTKRLQALRREREAAAAELAGLEADAGRPVEVPDEGGARELLARLGAILEEAAAGGDAFDDLEVREVVDMLTGGRVDLVQAGGREIKRGWLRGTFRLRLPGVPGPDADAAGQAVAIDFRAPAPCEAHADAVKELYDQGLLYKEIGARLGIHHKLASKALAAWHRVRGLEPPDGRSRRSALTPAQRTLEPPAFMRMADEAVRLYDRGLLYDEVAARLGCDRNTAAKAIRHGCGLLGRAVPDGRTRRKLLGRYAPKPADDGPRPSPA
ncbi:recombinase family protein [Paludisphaera mucosa]|uniref:Recombinase family protein n=1 Tax=Paludisphaera mucosa TaxID=3030827 RepID=A0ABT6FLI7_9BACT|nr:recombinase family protein [Paludisphaera mucosa]MDG3008384.1 recombinase family protein [Paludisphaera mucosa]